MGFVGVIAEAESKSFPSVIDKTRLQASPHRPVLTSHLTVNFHVSMFAGTSSARIELNKRRAVPKAVCRRAMLMRRLNERVERIVLGQSKWYFMTALKENGRLEEMWRRF
jgi:hypothetical protein